MWVWARNTSSKELFCVSIAMFLEHSSKPFYDKTIIIITKLRTNTECPKPSSATFSKNEPGWWIICYKLSDPFKIHSNTKVWWFAIHEEIRTSNTKSYRIPNFSEITIHNPLSTGISNSLMTWGLVKCVVSNQPNHEKIYNYSVPAFSLRLRWFFHAAPTCDVQQ